MKLGGVGYEVAIPISTFTALPQKAAAVTLRIYTHVREDAIVLFGFATLEEKSVFERLISVSGIGPKLALTILSGLATSDLIGAIRTGDVQKLVRIPGVGKKTAERMVLELKDKLAAGTEGAPAAGQASTNGASPDESSGTGCSFGTPEFGLLPSSCGRGDPEGAGARRASGFRASLPGCHAAGALKPFLFLQLGLGRRRPRSLGLLLNVVQSVSHQFLQFGLNAG